MSMHASAHACTHMHMYVRVYTHTHMCTHQPLDSNPKNMKSLKTEYGEN